MSSPEHLAWYVGAPAGDGSCDVASLLYAVDTHYGRVVTGVGERPVGTLGDVLSEQRRLRFVGRSAEIELFRAALDDAIEPPFSVLHVHGPGGIGKTSLLQAFGVVATGAGATVARLDGHDLHPSPMSVIEALSETMAVPTGDGPSTCRGAVGGWCCWSTPTST